jgi:hypothetical protein
MGVGERMGSMLGRERSTVTLLAAGRGGDDFLLALAVGHTLVGALGASR